MLKVSQVENQRLVDLKSKHESQIRELMGLVDKLSERLTKVTEEKDCLSRKLKEDSSLTSELVDLKTQMSKLHQQTSTVFEKLENRVTGG